MENFQFIHIEGYARKGSVQHLRSRSVEISSGNPNLKKVQHRESRTIKTWSIRDIANEAMRKKGHHPHVENPKPPEIIFGEPVYEAVKAARVWAAKATDAIGRKLRKDGLCMLCGVVSVPRNAEIDFTAFKRETIQFLMQQYGKRLLSVIEHQDEAHPHLHFYCVPLLNEPFSILHPGYAAAAEAKANKQLKGDQNRAYKAAMVDFQDLFFKNVASKFNLQRSGPKRKRLSRPQFFRQKNLNEKPQGLFHEIVFEPQTEMVPPLTRWLYVLKNLKTLREKEEQLKHTATPSHSQQDANCLSNTGAEPIEEPPEQDELEIARIAFEKKKSLEDQAIPDSENDDFSNNY